MVLKSDQEPSIMVVLNSLAKRRSATSKLEVREGSGVKSVCPSSSGRSIHEASPVGSSGSNGVIERAIQGIEGQVRTLKLALETRIGVGISSDHDVAPWMIEYAATVINKGQVSADGKTSYERLKGKPAPLCGLDFGERVLWKSTVQAKERRDEMDSDRRHGVFLGQRAFRRVRGRYAGRDVSSAYITSETRGEKMGRCRKLCGGVAVEAQQSS